MGKQILATGVDVMTSGNHLWDRRGSEDYIEGEEKLVRPAIVGFLVFLCMARKKRRSEGKYKPATQELTSPRLQLDNIIKPPPARQFESLPLGWGVLIDDLFAGLYAAIVVAIGMALVF